MANAMKGSSVSRVVAVASRYANNPPAFVQNLNIPKFYGSYEELVKDEEVQVVYVASTNDLHKSGVLMALQHGKHVLCEKPLGINSEEVKEMVALAKEKGLFFMEALWSRFFPSYLKLREAIDEGRIGEIISVEGTFGVNIGKPGGNSSNNPNSTKTNNSEKESRDKERLVNGALGGGALLDIGIYLISLTTFVFGKQRPEDVKASAEFFTVGGPDQKVEMDFTYPANKGGKKPTAHLLCNFAEDLPNELIVVGEKGKITIAKPFWCPEQVTIVTHDGEKTKEEVLPFPVPKNGGSYVYANSSGLYYEVQEVERCIFNKEQQSPKMSWEGSLEVMELIDKVKQLIGLKFVGLEK
eukprot:TRINITY_DN6809_c0_g1_i2.p1 TRINITY_DN6809_c0_g1~~TRINITY_DN6809_c0_g1_i2.p1  ORF type:complete len:354 (-),score=124.85 TRINITY_DN6809_c0_g1_i2:91-1152(-)